MGLTAGGWRGGGGQGSGGRGGSRGRGRDGECTVATRCGLAAGHLRHRPTRRASWEQAQVRSSVESGPVRAALAVGPTPPLPVPLLLRGRLTACDSVLAGRRPLLAWLVAWRLHDWPSGDS